jgi:hypothetical protein
LLTQKIINQRKLLELLSRDYLRTRSDATPAFVELEGLELAAASPSVR